MCLFLCMFRYKFKLVYVSISFFLETTRVKYNTFSCIFLCTFSVDLHFNVNFIRKQVKSNIIRFYSTE
ncbi:hypothetical protein HanXRQr2_Chr03g0099461 [Helianthus annuus]|uniref:Uncharacterized protein n=1 Tax=Helianthus annuus TaxID=4232 RepID=A0A9K3JDB8_HELAN|nr:hypothetical protein HanXRQr2_Chr03g0099461 [Helianthus annuus]KAJ0942745.1 hypothetical protein HanPSC8_Chr03g0095751 [Helianthus annuus]